MVKKKLAVLGLAAVMTVAFMPAMAFMGTTVYAEETQVTTTIPSDGVLTSGSYKLTSDLTQSVTVKSGVTASLDLSGKTLINTDNLDTITVEKGATLTITDSSTGTKGTVDNVSHQRAAIVNNGTVDIKDGVNITRSKENGKENGNTYYNILNHGSLTIDDAVVSQTGGFSSLIDNGYYNYTDSSNPRLGYVSGTNEANPTLTINGGTFTGGINTVKNDDGGVLTINNGTFKNQTQSSVFNWNKATINNGTFSTTSENGIVANGNQGKYDNGELTINGGTYTGKYLLSRTQDNVKTNNGYVSVKDGDYTGLSQGTVKAGTKYSNTKFISGGTFKSLPTANLTDKAATATVTNGSTTTYAVGQDAIAKAAEDSSNTVTVTKGIVSLTGANAKIVNDANNNGTVTVDGTTVNAGDNVQPNAAQTIANLKSEIASLKSQLAQAQASASSAQNTSNDSARQITQLKKDLADAQAQLKTAQAQAASQGSTLTAPAKVMNLKAKAGKRYVKLSWTALQSNVTGYRVYRKTKGGKYAKVKTITKASTASWTNKGLKKGKTYYYKVRAYKSITSGELWGAYSNTAKAVAK